MTAARLIVLSFTLLSGETLAAQSTVPERPTPIQDNSFLIEEAYNQEPGVVQHINTFAQTVGKSIWAFSFTQEWPFLSQRHQLSYTVPIVRADESSGSAGIGDIALNYRYQLVGDGDAAVAFSPRLSALIPTGSEQHGRGAGGTGLQVNLPVSVVLSPLVVTHSNAGATYTPRSRNEAGDVAGTVGFNVGQSVIWLVHPRVNVMLEAAWISTESVVGPDAVERSRGLFLSPGLRGAIDLPSGLQIVPGFAIPIGIGPSRGERQLFFYLSLEHPFTRSGG